MYKFSHHISNAKLVLVRKQVGDPSCAALIVMRAPNRRFAQEPDKCPPPCQPKRRSGKLLIGTIGIGLLTGGAVVYAKSSPEARNWLETNAPLANDFVALVYQERTTYWQFTRNQMSSLRTWLTDFIFGPEGITPIENPSRSQQDIDEDAKKAYAKQDYTLPPPAMKPLYTEPKKPVKVPDIETPANVVQTEKCEPRPPIEVNVSKDTVELEHDMYENTKIAVDNYHNAIKMFQAYNKALHEIIELPVEYLPQRTFTSLQSAQTERNNFVTKAHEAANKAKRAIDTLERMIKSNQIKAPPENLAAIKRALIKFREDLGKAEADYDAERERSVLSDKYWAKVEAARKAYKDELQILFPGVDITRRELDLKGDTDLLLLYTLKQIQFLQNELAELQTSLERKINKAIECHDEKAIIEAKVEETIHRERIQKELEFQKKSLEIQAEANRQLKEQLKRQSEINLEVLQNRIAKKEKELMTNLNRTVSEQLEKESVIFKQQVAAMAGKMKAIEQTLKQRAKADEEAKRSQSLWAAAEALLAATRRSTPETNIYCEVKALERAGQGDKLVQTVIKAIPADVREKGILTERSLREKFDTMEKTAVKVALIGPHGASLPMYFLSWLQSKLLFQSFSEIPRDELDNRPVDFTTLDTFDVMQRARYYMDQGNLATALRYVNLLQGAPRAAARCWVEAARRHLEIRQAAETVMAHASVSGLLYL